MALITEDDNNQIRGYVHEPNTVLNNKLNIVLLLSFTTVLGLGIGHFLGWSHFWNNQQRLSLSQVMKLRQLQNDLLDCMEKQQQPNDDILQKNLDKNLIDKVC